MFLNMVSNPRKNQQSAQALTPKQHLKNRLGIDLSNLKSDSDWSIARVPERVRDGMSDAPEEDFQKEARYSLESLYDVFVGQTAETALSSKLSRDERDHLTEFFENVSSKLRNTPSLSVANKQTLAVAKGACSLLSDLRRLEDSGNILRKDASRGIRHTLTKPQPLKPTSSTKIFEHLNSLTSFEAERFAKRHPLQGLRAMSSPSVMGPSNCYQTHKFSLGRGGFGRTRLARDIQADEYACVKKVDVLGSARSFPEVNRQQKIASKYISNIKALHSQPESVKQHLLFPSHLIGYDSRNRQQHSPSLLAEYMSLADKTVGDVVEQAQFLRLITSGVFSEKGSVGSLNQDGVNKILASIGNGIRRSAKLSPSERGAYLSVLNAIRSGNELTQFYLNTVAQKVIEIIADFQNQELAHRDIKPDNIMFYKNESGKYTIKLIDLENCSPYDDSDPLCDIIAHMTYSAPEINLSDYSAVLDQSNYENDRKQADAFSLGLTLKKIIGNTDFAIKRLSTDVKNECIDKLVSQSQMHKNVSDELKALLGVGRIRRGFSSKSFDQRVADVQLPEDEGLFLSMLGVEEQALHTRIMIAKREIINEFSFQSINGRGKGSFLYHTLQNINQEPNESVREYNCLQLMNAAFHLLEHHICRGVIKTEYNLELIPKKPNVIDSLTGRRGNRKTHTEINTLAKKNNLVLNDLIDGMLCIRPEKRTMPSTVIERGYFQKESERNPDAQRSNNALYVLDDEDFQAMTEFLICSATYIGSQELQNAGVDFQASAEDRLGYQQVNAAVMAEAKRAETRINDTNSKPLLLKVNEVKDGLRRFKRMLVHHHEIDGYTQKLVPANAAMR